MLVILLLVNLIFVYFFYSIGFVYWNYLVWFVLSIIFFLSLFSDEGQKSLKFFIKNFFLEYIMYINFLIIISWIYLIINYFLQQQYGLWMMSDLKSLFFVLWITIFIYIFSCVFYKKNILKVSYFGFFVIFVYMFYLLKDLKVFEYFISFILSISVVGHLIYFVKRSSYNRFIIYVLFLSSIVSLFLIIKNTLNISSNTLSLVVQLVVLVILLYSVYIEKNYNKYLDIKKQIEKREYEMNVFGFSDIKIDKKKELYFKNFNKDYYDLIIDFFLHAPNTVKIIFSLTNVIPVLFATWFFYKSLWWWNGIYNESIYWAQGIVFFINFLLFKHLKWFVFIQRIFAFFMINFITYFTIIDFMWKNYLYISIWWIIWNLFTTVFMIFIWKKNDILWVVDYLTWSIINFLWVLLNIYFLLKIWLNIYLISWIILLYFGLYLFLYRIIYKKIFM